MILLLTGCLINTDLYEQRRNALTDGDGDGFASADDCDDGDPSVHPSAAERCDGVDQDCDGAVDEDASDPVSWYRDADGDGAGDPAAAESACDAPLGFVANDDDCDDTDPAVFPGAEDVWYDGVDANCDGADDYDADSDGDRWDEAGGTDCDDEDATVSGHTAEGWADGGIDNNCDGSIEDPAIGDLESLGVPIYGAGAGGSFGVTVLALPAGWADEEAVLLAAAPFSASGDVYGWRASQLTGAPSLASATWHRTGTADGDYLGFGMGWAGDASRPLVVLGAEGAGGTRGRVDVWVGADLAGPASLSIEGETLGGYLGAQVVSGYDHDGDGVADVLVVAQLDSRIATNAGAAFVFLDDAVLAGALPASGADVEFTTTYGGALLTVTSVGDVDDDGLDDLGFTQDIPAADGPGGLLLTQARSPGAYDIVSTASTQLHGGPFVFGRVWDPDADGAPSLLAASGGIHSFPLPLEGSVTPWDDAEASLEFEEVGSSTRWIRTDTGDYAEHGAFVAASANYEGSRGVVSVQRPYWREGQRIDDAPFQALGEAAGDRAGAGLDVLDWDGDGVTDLAVGAPEADAGGTGSGALYLLPGPR